MVSHHKSFLLTAMAAALLPAAPLKTLFDGNVQLELSYDAEDKIPQGFEALYTEKDGKWSLSGVKGLKTEGDLTRTKQALEKERKDHKDTKAALAKFTSLGSTEELQEKLDKLGELELASDGKLDDAKINELVEKRLAAKTAPLQRQLDAAKVKEQELIAERDGYITEKKNRTIGDAVREQALKLKVRDTALDDVLLYGERIFEIDDDGKVITRDNVGTTPGLTPDQWLQEMQSKRPHWWPDSQGGGGSGGRQTGGVNPWSSKDWNMTAQGQYLQTHGEEKAKQMAKAAGTTLGGPRPAKAV